MAKLLHKEIRKLEQDLLCLSGLVEQNLHKAVRSFIKRDAILAEKVKNGDRLIDEMEVKIEEECLKLLALHQPVAVDLRMIISVLKMNNDLERVGDFAVRIAKRAKSITEMPGVEIPPQIQEMASLAWKMVQDSLDAYVKMDVASAAEICIRDKEVDQLKKVIHDFAIAFLKTESEECDGYLDIYRVADALERIADHATNICEDVIYLLEGDIVRHQK